MRPDGREDLSRHLLVALEVRDDVPLSLHVDLLGSDKACFSLVIGESRQCTMVVDERLHDHDVGSTVIMIIFVVPAIELANGHFWAKPRP